MQPKITTFSEDTSEPKIDHPRPDRLISSHSPLRETWEHYQNRGVSAGQWQCEPGAWRICFADDTDEFFHVISGRIRITDNNGISAEFGPGEACVIPSGFTGTFEVLEAVKKHYVFVQRNLGTASRLA